MQTATIICVLAFLGICQAIATDVQTEHLGSQLADNTEVKINAVIEKESPAEKSQETNDSDDDALKIDCNCGETGAVDSREIPNTVIRAKRQCGYGYGYGCCCGPTGPPVTGMPCGCCGGCWGR